MADISFIEFIIYGFFAYSGMLMLIISVIKEVPMTKSLSIIRAIYLVPSIIASGVLAQVGPSIITTSVQNTIIAVNSSESFYETITSSYPIQLGSPWALFHMMLFVVMMVYVISNVLLLATRKE